MLSRVISPSLHATQFPRRPPEAIAALPAPAAVSSPLSPLLFGAAGLAPGSQVGRFRLLDKLGQGAAGVVFAAHDEANIRPVALKILRNRTDPILAQRFLREGRIGATLRHRNLVEVLELVQAAERSFIVMELVRGETLQAKLRGAAGQALPLDVALQIARRVCRGLAKAHRTGVVHRDVKPGNVMISHTGEVKLLDFGIAKVGDGAEETLAIPSRQIPIQLTGPGVMLGTPGYMAPEQARGAPVDARADVFSLGVLLYQMLTGHRPFRGESAFDVLVAVDRDQPLPPSAGQPDHPEPLKPMINHVVLRCLEKDPARRHADAGELLREVQALSRLVLLSRVPC